MNTPFDSALRDALADLADVPPPPGLATAAIRTARRRRAGQWAAGVAAVVAVMVAVPMAVAAARTGDDPPATTTLRPLVITAYNLERGEQPLLLDRKTGDYIPLAFHGVEPSPDGYQALVFRGEENPRWNVAAWVLDISSGQTQLIDGHIGEIFGAREPEVVSEWSAGDPHESPGGWSRNGEEILLTYDFSRERGFFHYKGPGFALVDADTLATTFVSHYEAARPTTQTQINDMGNRYVWAPSGTEIALTESVESSEPDRFTVNAIRFYNLDGELTRIVPATAPLLTEAGFSPDGTRMALQHPFLGEPIQVVDAVTGELLHTPPAPPSLLVGWADDQHLVIRDERNLMVVDLAGEVLQTVRMAAAEPSGVYIGSSAGLPPEAASITFGFGD